MCLHASIGISSPEKITGCDLGRGFMKLCGSLASRRERRFSITNGGLVGLLSAKLGPRLPWKRVSGQEPTLADFR